MELKNYYEILGVRQEAPPEEVKRAYRKLARKYHPDVSQETDSEAKFKEVNEAWEVLKDPQKKAQYDRVLKGEWQPQEQGFNQSYGSDFYSGDHPEDYSFAGGGDFSDFFNSIFGQRQHARAQAHTNRKIKGQDLHARLQIPLELAYQGGVQNLTLNVPSLNDQGHMVQQQKTLQVKIPPGVKRKSQIRLKGQGAPGLNGAENGDLYIEMDVLAHRYFTLHNKDIELKLPVTPWEAALGAQITVPTLSSNVKLTIPPNAQNGQKLRLKGKGLPGQPPGDQIVTLVLTLPHATTHEAKKLYEQMAQVMPINPREHLEVNHDKV